MSPDKAGRNLRRRKILILTISRMERQLFYLLFLLSLPLVFRFHPRTLTLVALSILLVGGAAAAFLRGVMETRRTNPLGDADRVFHANSLLTTAWDVRKPDDTRYSELSRQIVLNRAASLLGRIRVKQVYPYRPSRYLRLVPLALLFLGGVWLATIALDATGPVWRDYPDEVLSRRRNPMPEESPEDDRSGAALADELTRLSEAIERRPSEKDLLRDQELALPDDAVRNRRLGATDLLDQDSGRPLTEGDITPDGSLRETREDQAQPLPGLNSGGLPTDMPAGEGETERSSSGDDDGAPGDAATSPGEATADGTSGESDGKGPAGEDQDDENGSSASAKPGESGGTTPDAENEPGIGEPGTEGQPDTPGPGRTRPRTMTDAIRRVLELPRVGAEGDVSELLALETPGDSAVADGNSPPINQDFERRLQMTLNRLPVPRDVQEYVRNYFIIIARRQEEEG